jgi:hypothetical protein
MNQELFRKCAVRSKHFPKVFQIEKTHQGLPDGNYTVPVLSITMCARPPQQSWRFDKIKYQVLIVVSLDIHFSKAFNHGEQIISPGSLFDYHLTLMKAHGITILIKQLELLPGQ